MRRRLLRLFASYFIFLFVFTSCGNRKPDTEDIINYLKDLKSYSCSVNIEIKNDKQKIDYTGKQFYSSSYGKRFELGKERIFIYKGNKIFARDLNNGISYNTDLNFDSLFRLCFIDEYVNLIYTNERVDNLLKNIYNEEYQVIILDIPGNNKNIYKAELYVNSKSSIPGYLVIYDSSGREKVKVKYVDFKANVNLEKDVFDVHSLDNKE